MGVGNSVGGKGGVLYVDSMFEVIIDDSVMSNNSALVGGCLFARACNYPDDFMDHDLYKGVQVPDKHCMMTLNTLVVYADYHCIGVFVLIIIVCSHLLYVSSQTEL